MTNILVVGDVMLDRYWFGDVSRLSQEAPVPIVKMNREEVRAGAAANVAINCQAMGASTFLVSSIGTDEYGEKVVDCLHKAGVKHQLKTTIGAITTQKLRVIGRNQQIVRIDFEDGESLSPIDAFSVPFESFDIVLFSDYGKGALVHVQDLISTAKSKGKTVLVDPKGHDYRKYRGADLIKPNMDEMRSLVGGWSTENELTEKANKLLVDAELGAILLTRASQGMTLFQGGKSKSISSDAKEVFDVSGAGDTAIAAFAVSLSKGFCFEDAMHYANRAAGVVVGKFGTSVANELEVFGGKARRAYQEV